MPAILDLQGKKLGRLTVIERAHIPGAHNVMWRCECECGNETVAAAANLGKTTFSCGCLAKETARALLLGNTNNRTHNMSHTDEHDTWLVMRQRCYNEKNPKYPRYGGRGIKICERWLNSFEAFYEDMGKKPSNKHSIERKNNDLDYSPENCIWATNKIQSRNKSNNNILTIDGRSLCIVDWCAEIGVPRWKPYDMCRPTGAKRNGPPQFPSPETAFMELYRRHNAKL